MAPKSKSAKKEAKKLEKQRRALLLHQEEKLKEIQRDVAIQNTMKRDIDRNMQEMVINIKVPEMITELKAMYQTFDNAYEMKSHYIKHLFKIIDEANFQFHRCHGNHVMNVDFLVKWFLSNLDNLKKENDENTKALLKQAEDTTNYNTEHHNIAETHLQLLLFQKNKTFNEFIWGKRGRFWVIEDSHRETYQDIVDKLVSFLEDESHNVWENCLQVMNTYVASNLNIVTISKDLREKNNFLEDIIMKQEKLIINNEKIVLRLNNELQSFNTDVRAVYRQDRYNRYKGAYLIRKNEFNKNCAFDKLLLSTLIDETYSVKESLEAAQRKMNKALTLGRLCRKYELIREKVLPFGSDECDGFQEIKRSTEKKGDVPSGMINDPESLISEVLSNTSGLIRLWRRIAKVETVKIALEREKALLKQANRCLRIQLKKENKYGSMGQLSVHEMRSINDFQSVPSKELVQG